MNSYRIRQTSPFFWLISLLGIIFLGIGIMIVFAVNKVFPNALASIFVLVPFIIVAFIVPSYTSTVETQITMDEMMIKIIWLKQFILQDKANIEIYWNDILNYNFEVRKQFDKFEITLKSGEKFRFYHNNDHNSKDDFLKFLNDFKIKVNQINTNSNNSILNAKTIYETFLGGLIAIFAIIVIIGLPIIFFIFKNEHHITNYAGLIIIYVSAFFYLIQVIMHKFENKTNR